MKKKTKKRPKVVQKTPNLYAPKFGLCFRSEMGWETKEDLKKSICIYIFFLLIGRLKSQNRWVGHSKTLLNKLNKLRLCFTRYTFI